MRTCANSDCTKSIDHLRADARYCTSSCSERARRARREGLNDPGAAQAFWTRFKAVKREAHRHPRRARPAAS